jgi:hypothetical protein
MTKREGERGTAGLAKVKDVRDYLGARSWQYGLRNEGRLPRGEDGSGRKTTESLYDRSRVARRWDLQARAAEDRMGASAKPNGGGGGSCSHAKEAEGRTEGKRGEIRRWRWSWGRDGVVAEERRS